MSATSVPAPGSTINGTDLSSAPLTLVSVPLSGYAMRVRYIAAKKELGSEMLQIKTPAEFGGLKSEEYLAFNPFGKMPILIVRDPPMTSPPAIFESAVIASYVVDRCADIMPSFLPHTPEKRAVANLVTSICDNYLAQLQPYLYKPFDPSVDRKAKIDEMGTSFDAIELVMDPEGPYVCGKEVSLGDAGLFGNLPFYDFIMPTFFGVHPTDNRPKLAKWRNFMLQESEASKECYQEVWTSLEKWWDDGRWEKLGMTPLKSGKPVSPVMQYN